MPTPTHPRPLTPRRLRAAHAALALPLLLGACAGLDRTDQGRLQPQTVEGPCQVKKFFILPQRSVPVEVAAGASGTCRFTLFNPDLQIVLSAALVTTPPAHGRATADLPMAGRQAGVTYTPAPGYTGPDRFSVTLEPGATGLTVNVSVQPGVPAAPPP